MTNGELNHPTAARLLKDWEDFGEEREKMRKRLPPVLPPDLQCQILMSDVAVFAQFLNRVIKHLEQQERDQDQEA